MAPSHRSHSAIRNEAGSGEEGLTKGKEKQRGRQRRDDLLGDTRPLGGIRGGVSGIDKKR